MVTLNNVKEQISNTLAQEKAYGLPSVCVKYGLDEGTEEEAYNSKRIYVMKRLANKDKNFILNLGRKLMQEYPSSDLARILESFFPDGGFSLSNITREKILNKLNSQKNLTGKLELIDFFIRIFNVDRLPSIYNLFETLEDDIRQHMINNDDWDYLYLFKNALDLMYLSDEKFICFLEELVHPMIRMKEEQEEYVKLINNFIKVEGYELLASDSISNEIIYKVQKILRYGVKGDFKNLIFASDGPKPEIILIDSLNNDIKIVKNEEYCLIYDRKIGKDGLKWGELMQWWSRKNNIDNCNIKDEQTLYLRLASSLDSPPEKLFFYTYYQEYKNKLKENLPVLIPQVYLHYDPFTVKQLHGNKRLTHQRMDFLILFSDKDRVVIEIDGKQHYSDEDKSSPKKYSEMVAADRLLSFNGYEIFRFGGYELNQKNNKQIIIEFFNKLLEKYKIY